MMRFVLFPQFGRRRRYNGSAMGRQPCSAYRVLMLAALLWAPGSADATPLRVRSSEATVEAIIHRDHAEYVVRFDGPVNHAASRLMIMQADQVVQVLAPLMDGAGDVIFASGATPALGHYVLRREATSMDGEVTRGDNPFSVLR